MNVCSGVSSFNKFIHEVSVDSDTSSTVDYSSDGEECDIYPPSPLSHSSRVSRESIFTKQNRSWIWWIRFIISWVLYPMKLIFFLPLYFIRSAFPTSKAPVRSGNYPSVPQSPRRLQNLKDQFVQRATDRRHGVVEVCSNAHLHNIFPRWCGTMLQLFSLPGIRLPQKNLKHGLYLEHWCYDTAFHWL